MQLLTSLSLLSFLISFIHKMHSFIIFVYIGIQQLCKGGCWKSCNCSKFHGILNAINLDIWEPYNNKFIPVSRLYISCIKWSQMCFPRMEGKFYNWIILNLLLYVGCSGGHCPILVVFYLEWYGFLKIRHSWNYKVLNHAKFLYYN